MSARFQRSNLEALLWKKLDHLTKNEQIPESILEPISDKLLQWKKNGGIIKKKRKKTTAKQRTLIFASVTDGAQLQKQDEQEKEEEEKKSEDREENSEEKKNEAEENQRREEQEKDKLQDLEEHKEIEVATNMDLDKENRKRKRVDVSKSEAEQWTHQQVGAWVEEIGLGEFENVFVEQLIDGGALFALKEEDLKELGLKIGQRKLFLRSLPL